MALYGTTGIIRSGKTALDTIWSLIEAEKDTKKDEPETEVYANYPIAHKRIKMLNTVDDFMALKFDEMNGLATIQEFQVWVESRLSGKEITRMVDKTVLQSGKLGFDILWDAQLSSSVDKRVRFNTTSWFTTRRKIKLEALNGWIFRYMYLDERLNIHKFRLPNIPDGWKTLKSLVLDKYDTRAIAELKRKFEQQKKEGGLSDEQKKYEKEQTEILTQPNGELLDKITPEIKEQPTTLLEQLAQKGMEIVS